MAERIPFIGGSKKGRSVSFNPQRTVNLFLELDPSGKNPVGMFLIPGNTLFAALTLGPVRGMRAVGSYMYVASGPKLYRVETGGAFNELGNLATSSGPVVLSDNGLQVAAIDGTGLYTYTIASSAFARVSDPDFGGGSIIDFLDTYLIAGPQGTHSFQISSENEGTAWASADTTSVEGASGNLVTFLVANGNIWFWKEASSLVFWNSGNADFPFEPIDGSESEFGCAAKYSPAKTDNSVLWLTKNRDGQGQVARAEGYRPVIVSSRALDYQISTYSRIDDAIGWTQQQEGHTFYWLTFPTAEKTWVYDLSIQDPELAWHERESYAGSGQTLGRSAANCHCFFNGKHYIGDFRNGNIYELRTTLYAENGELIRWERTGQYISDDGKPIRFSSFELDCETGVGLTSGQGSDPKVYLDWSDDGGKTWSNKLERSLGALGQYDAPVEWRKLGSSKGKGRVFRLTGSDPVKTAIFAARCTMSR
jgi:hypothetical protein